MTDEQERLEIVKEFKSLGKKFKYLGVLMTMVWIDDTDTHPSLTADYVDRNGIIRTHSFYGDRWKILKEENPTSDIIELKRS